MATYTQQQLQERLRELPEALQEAMFSPDIATKMFTIGKEHGLTIDKIGFAAEETGYVILGFTKPQEFIQALKNRLGVDEEKARSISSEINREIFYSLREALKQTHQIEERESGIMNYELGGTAVPPIITPSPQPQPQPPQIPLSPAKPSETKPPLRPPLKPQSIDLRTQPATRPPQQPQKPPLSELLPKAPPSTPTPPLPESGIMNYELGETDKMTSPPKPTVTQSPSPKPSAASKPPSPLPQPEVMPGGGVFAPPSAGESGIMNYELGKPKQELGIRNKELGGTDEKTLPPEEKTRERQTASQKYDPYREPVE